MNGIAVLHKRPDEISQILVRAAWVLAGGGMLGCGMLVCGSLETKAGHLQEPGKILAQSLFS